jgi:hypothetical protein
MGVKRKIKLGKWFDSAFKLPYAMRGPRGGALDASVARKSVAWSAG